MVGTTQHTDLELRIYKTVNMKILSVFKLKINNNL